MTSLAALSQRLSAAALCLALSAGLSGAGQKPAAESPPPATQAQPGAAGAGKSSAAACASIAKGIGSRIEAMKALKEEIAKEGTPDAKLFRQKGALPAFKHVPGDPARRLTDERKTVEQLNAMLRSLGCAPVDIDYELAQPAKQDKTKKGSKTSKF